jgi:hypothetical protein
MITSDWSLRFKAGIRKMNNTCGISEYPNDTIARKRCPKSRYVPRKLLFRGRRYRNHSRLQSHLVDLFTHEFPACNMHNARLFIGKTGVPRK